VNLKIDIADGTPIYLQIVDQICRSIALGHLKPEDALPSVRQLAIDLTINPNTVARAYLELEHRGILHKRQGQGTYVSALAIETSRRERRKIIASLFEKAIVEALNAGLGPADIEEIYNQQLRRYKVEKS
jgi:GntR family transcriptional regulator